MKNILFYIQGSIQFFVALGAIVSGFMLIIEPSGKLLQAPLEMLSGSPFSNFLIPRIILFLVNGIGQFVAGIFTFRKHPQSSLLGAIFGLGLMIWMFVQVNMIGGGHILQYFYFTLGIVETSIAFLICKIK